MNNLLGMRSGCVLEVSVRFLRHACMNIFKRLLIQRAMSASAIVNVVNFHKSEISILVEVKKKTNQFLLYLIIKILFSV